MKVTFIMPCVGKKPGVPYVKTWQMEPLAIAVLSAITPADVKKEFFDDRLEDIPYEAPTDLVAINVETYTAKRAYQIAGEYQKRGVPVVMGGFHATLMSEEVATKADSVVIGAAESVWLEVVEDARANRLQPVYRGGETNCFSQEMPDRSIYLGKKYTRVTLIETGRGCRYACEFCSICRFFESRYYPREIGQVLREIRDNPSLVYFFIDDNVAVDKLHTKELLTALIPLKVRWVGQVSIDIAKHEDLLSLMAKSGCMGVLIGFESLNHENLESMGKNVNAALADYEAALSLIRRYHLGVYATFLFGYDSDTTETFEETLAFSIRQKFFFTAFNHLVPYPGTPLYDRLEAEDRLLYPQWWLHDDYTFGQVAFRPENFTPDELAKTCLSYRNRFYSVRSILRRGLDLSVNSRGILRSVVYWTENFVSRGDVGLRQGLPLGLVHDKAEMRRS